VRRCESRGGCESALRAVAGDRVEYPWAGRSEASAFRWRACAAWRRGVPR